MPQRTVTEYEKSFLDAVHKTHPEFQPLEGTTYEEVFDNVTYVITDLQERLRRAEKYAEDLIGCGKAKKRLQEFDALFDDKDGTYSYYELTKRQLLVMEANKEELGEPYIDNYEGYTKPYQLKIESPLPRGAKL